MDETREHAKLQKPVVKDGYLSGQPCKLISKCLRIDCSLRFSCLALEGKNKLNSIGRTSMVLSLH